MSVHDRESFTPIGTNDRESRHLYDTGDLIQNRDHRSDALLPLLARGPLGAKTVTCMHFTVINLTLHFTLHVQSRHYNATAKPALGNSDTLHVTDLA